MSFFFTMQLKIGVLLALKLKCSVFTFVQKMNNGLYQVYCIKPEGLEDSIFIPLEGLMKASIQIDTKEMSMPITCT